MVGRAPFVFFGILTYFQLLTLSIPHTAYRSPRACFLRFASLLYGPIHPTSRFAHVPRPRRLFLFCVLPPPAWWLCLMQNSNRPLWRERENQQLAATSLNRPTMSKMTSRLERRWPAVKKQQPGRIPDPRTGSCRRTCHPPRPHSSQLPRCQATAGHCLTANN